MARKDVDLVIRAKDQAAKVVDQITTAINAFNTAQGKMSSGAAKTGSAMGELGAAFTKLDTAIKAMQAGEKIAADFARAQQATEKLKSELADAARQAATSGQALTQMDSRVEQLTRKVNGAVEALKRQKDALRETRAEHTSFGSQITAAETRIDKLSAGITRNDAAFAKSNEKLEASAARYARLKDEISKVDQPTKTMTNSLGAAQRALERNLATVEKQIASGQRLTEQRVQETANLARLKGEYDRSAGAVDKNARMVERTNAALERHKTNLRAAQASQRALSEQHDKAAVATVRLSSQYERASADLVTLKANADKAAESIRRLAGASAGTARREGMGRRDELTSATFAMEANYREAAQEANRLAAAMQGIGPPTREASEAFAQAKNTAGQMKAELRVMRQGLGEVRQAYAQMDGTVEGNRRGLQGMIEAEQRMVAALAKTREAARQTAGAIQQLHAIPPMRPDVPAGAPERLSRYTRLLRALGHEKRTSLSWTQRLRGEVLSLVTAYAGIYSAIRIINGIIDATKKWEAATNRISVATGQSAQRTTDELDFLRRTSDRLGVSLAVMADEYSKLAVAADAAGFQSSSVRRIFLAVAESARVNKNSTEEMSGIFLALTQMISKGKITSEELRRQLGDRLPGAFNIMADALGLTTAELDKFMATGQILSDEANMTAFAAELTRRFGPQLGEALNTTTTALGQLENAAFQAMLAFGEAGFIDAFNNLLHDLVETMRSPEFQSFAERISAALGAVVDMIAWMIRNFRLLVSVVTALVGVKIVTTFMQVRTALQLTDKEAKAAAASLGFTARNATRAAVAMRGLTAAIAPALAVVAVTTLIGTWLTSATDVNEVLSEHLRIMDAVRNAYDETGPALDAWRQKLSETVTLSDVQGNLEDMREAFRGAIMDMQTLASGGSNILFNFFGRDLARGRAAIQHVADASDDLKKAVQDVTAEFSAGRIPVNQLVAAMNDAAQAASNGSREDRLYARQAVQTARTVAELGEGVAELDGTIVAMTGATDEATGALRDVSGALEDVDRSAELAAAALAEYTEIMEGLRKKIPEVRAELDYLEQSNAITEMMQDAIAAAREVGNLADMWALVTGAIATAGQAQRALDESYVSGVVGGSLVDRIIQIESGGNAGARNPSSSATGLGQFIESTWLTMFQKYFPDRAAGMSREAILALRTEAALSRQMVELYLRENAQTLHSAGVAINDANLYLAHFLGPGGAIKVAQADPNTALSQLFSQATISANASIMQGRTAGQLTQWAAGRVGMSEGQVSLNETMLGIDQARADEAERQAEAARDFHETQAASIEQSNFELSVQDQALVQRETALAIRQAELEAQRAGTVLTDEERQAIAANVEARFREKQIEEETAEARKRATDAEAEITRLTQMRADLEEQMRTARAEGDSEKAEELRAKMEEVNEQLVAAIANAQAMWQAIGGDEAEAAILRLETARQAAERFNQEGRQSLIDWGRVGQMFADGLTSAFNDFAKAVAEGASIGEAARNAFLKFAADFLIQIGQMIVKQAILNALSGLGARGGFMGQLFGGLNVGVGHTGMRVGSGDGSRRTVSPALFANAARYHTGGYPGLRPGEIPIIAERGEQILAKDDPANMLNAPGASGGSGSGNVRPVKIVNRLASREVAAAVFEDDDGSEVIENYFRVNAAKISAILGGA